MFLQKRRNCDVEFQGSGLSKEDKMKLLEIAKKNALNVHGGLNKNESISMRAGGKKNNLLKTFKNMFLQ